MTCYAPNVFGAEAHKTGPMEKFYIFGLRMAKLHWLVAEVMANTQKDSNRQYSPNSGFGSKISYFMQRNIVTFWQSFIYDRIQL